MLKILYFITPFKFKKSIFLTILTFQVPLYFISHNGRRHKPCTKLYSELIFIIQRKRQINLTNVKMVLIDLVSTIIQLFLILFLTKVKTTFSFFIRHLLQFHPFFFLGFFLEKRHAFDRSRAERIFRYLNNLFCSCH